MKFSYDFKTLLDALIESQRRQNIQAFNNLGNIVKQLDHKSEKIAEILTDKNISEFEEILRCLCNQHDLLENLWIQLHRRGNFHGSIKVLKYMSELNPQNLAIKNNISALYIKIGNYQLAKTYINDCLADQRSVSEDVLNNKALLEKKLGNHAVSNQYLEKLLKINPKNVQALNNFANAKIEQGEFQSATHLFKKAIETDPMFVSSYRNVAKIINFRHEPKITTSLNKIDDKAEQLSVEEKNNLFYAKALMQIDHEEYKSAVCYLKKANSIRFNLLSNKYEQEIRELQSLNLENNSGKHQDKFSSPFVPIFIVGMPRSGTTLLEQILAASPNITPLGELNALELAYKNELKGFNLVSAYNEKVLEYTFNTSHIIDKNPYNFRRVPEILDNFKDAKVIYILRDAKSNMWSLYKTFFTEFSHAYSYDFRALTEYHEYFRKLYHKHLRLYKNRLLSVSYEDLVINKEKTLAEIFEFLELQNTIHEHTPGTKTIVRTASSFQVRQKMYKQPNVEWEKLKSFVPEINDLIIKD